MVSAALQCVSSDPREGEVREIHVSCGMLGGSPELDPNLPSRQAGFQHARHLKIPSFFQFILCWDLCLVLLLIPATGGRNYFHSLPSCSLQATFTVIYMLYTRFCGPDSEIALGRLPTITFPLSRSCWPDPQQGCRLGPAKHHFPDETCGFSL